MSLYPSLEDMKVDKLLQSQSEAVNNAISQYQQQHQQPLVSYPNAPPPYSMNPYPELNSLYPQVSNEDAEKKPNQSISYPDLGEYLGMELTTAMIAANMPEYLRNDNTMALATHATPTTTINNTSMVAPISGSSVGLFRGQVTNGVRELVLCKGSNNKVGFRVQAVNKGVFVCLVVKGSPAALAGLRFGDQILQINGTVVAGYSMDEVHKLIKKSDKNNISLVVRDRPLERAITLHKDSTGSLGFQFSEGKITAIVKDSSAAKNGLLIKHQILEVNGQNVIGLKDKEITKVLAEGGTVITLTIIPSMVYDVIMKELSTSFIKGKMDHSIPEF